MLEVIDNVKEAVTFAVGGAGLGFAVYHQTGAAGFAIKGGAYPVGACSFAVIGAVTGLAAYGVKKSILG
jgi:hypothetical protein